MLGSRVNSHASAGVSHGLAVSDHSLKAAARPPALGAHAPPRTSAIAASEFHSSPRGLQGLRELRYQDKNRLRCNALQQIDYTFYQEMQVDDVDVSYLWSRLEPLLGYLPDQDREEVHKALELAYMCHNGQLRKSGEPFITHPVEVTRILAELKLGKESLIAGLLHDSVEDTDKITFEDIEELFGQTARRIVEGETKFSKIGRLTEGDPNVDVKAVDLQQLFLSMTEEVRIILVKLADRLHNLRTLGSMPPHKQKRIADETLQVFAPLARLLGLYAVKDELEVTSFKYSDPEAYNSLVRRVEAIKAEQEPVILQAKSALAEILKKDTYLQMRVEKIEILPAYKSIYVMHKKLKAKGSSNGSSVENAKPLGNVSQLHIIIHEKTGDYDKLLYGTSTQLCYHMLGQIHSTWAPIPGEMKDYIATPKSNGYQSLHTTVLPLGSSDSLFPLEIQIRTHKMQQLAENGIASEGWASPYVTANESLDEYNYHPKRRMSTELNVNGTAGVKSDANGYDIGDETLKQLVTSSKWGNVRMNTEVMNRKINWLNSIREWQGEFLGMLSAREFVDTITDDLLGQRVFVFSPSGEVMHLPKGSTVVDFAYHVHTGVGNHMVAAKVNCNLVPPSYELKNAEVVEILTYSTPPNLASLVRHKEYYEHARTRSARYKLTKFLRDHGHVVNGKDQPVPLGEKGINDSDAITSSFDGEYSHDITWLVVQCKDETGLLAEITSAISSCGHDIKEYSGSGNFMNFKLKGDQDTVREMCDKIGASDAVITWAIGCRLPTVGGQK